MKSKKNSKISILIPCIASIAISICLLTPSTLAYFTQSITSNDNSISTAKLGYSITAYASSDQSLNTSKDTLVSELSTEKSNPTLINESNLIFYFTNIGDADIKIYCEVLDDYDEVTSSYLEKVTFASIEPQEDSDSRCKIKNLTSGNVYEIKVYYEYASSNITLPSGGYDSYYVKCNALTSIEEPEVEESVEEPNVEKSNVVIEPNETIIESNISESESESNEGSIED